MNLYEFRERQVTERAVAWDVIDIDDVTVTEKQLEPAEFERLKAEWLGREHGPSDRMG
jgi:hypothetical protein